MPDLLVARYEDGMPVPARLELGGAAPWVFDLGGVRFERFAVDFVDRRGDVVLHVAARPDEEAVALNSWLDGSWGEEVVLAEYPFPRDPDVAFRLRFDVRDDAVRLFVDDTQFGELPHRRPPSTITEVRSTAYLWRLETRRPHVGIGARPCGGAFLPEVVRSRSRAPLAWVSVEDQPAVREPLTSFRLNAVACTWMEEDVIEATVSNAYRQGCDRVYVIDNGSTDRTVERASKAGARVAGSFDLGYFDEIEKTRQMQALVDEVGPTEPTQHVWWLWLDADEFHHGPRGLTLRDYLGSLDRRFRVVGARFFNHLPSGQPAYVEGRHPLDFQPLCYELPFPHCEAGHFKHSLQRWDRDGASIASGDGFHRAESPEPLSEPSLAVFCHHFPFRAEEATRRRVSALFGDQQGAAARIKNPASEIHMRLRRRSLDALYRQRWQDVTFYPPCPQGYAPELRRWDDLVGPGEREVARW